MAAVFLIADRRLALKPRAVVQQGGGRRVQRMWKDKEAAISALMKRFKVSRDTIRREAERLNLGPKAWENRMPEILKDEAKRRLANTIVDFSLILRNQAANAEDFEGYKRAVSDGACIMTGQARSVLTDLQYCKRKIAQCSI